VFKNIIIIPGSFTNLSMNIIKELIISMLILCIIQLSYLICILINSLIDVQIFGLLIDSAFSSIVKKAIVLVKMKFLTFQQLI